MNNISQDKYKNIRKCDSILISKIQPYYFGFNLSNWAEFHGEGKGRINITFAEYYLGEKMNYYNEQEVNYVFNEVMNDILGEKLFKLYEGKSHYTQVINLGKKLFKDEVDTSSFLLEVMKVDEKLPRHTIQINFNERSDNTGQELENILNVRYEVDDYEQILNTPLNEGVQDSPALLVGRLLSQVINN